MKGRHVFGEHGRPDHWYVDGVEVTEAEYNAAFPPKSIKEICAGLQQAIIPWKPLASDAFGVHTSQIKEAMEHDKRIGVPTEYTAEGQPIFTSRAHRREFIQKHPIMIDGKMCRMVDHDGGYGDG